MGSWIMQVMKPATWLAPSLLPEAKANLDPAHATPVVKVHTPDHRTMQLLHQLPSSSTHRGPEEVECDSTSALAAPLQLPGPG